MEGKKRRRRRRRQQSEAYVAVCVGVVDRERLIALAKKEGEHAVATLSCRFDQSGLGLERENKKEAR
jgi:hypothetical protein